MAVTPNDTPKTISSIFMGNKNIKKTLATLRFLDIFDQGGSPGGFNKFISFISQTLSQKV